MWRMFVTHRTSLHVGPLAQFYQQTACHVWGQESAILIALLAVQGKPWEQGPPQPLPSPVADALYFQVQVNISMTLRVQQAAHQPRSLVKSVHAVQTFLQQDEPFFSKVPPLVLIKFEEFVREMVIAITCFDDMMKK